MNAYFKKLSTAMVFAALLAPTTALAQKSTGGVIGEARLHPGTWNSQRMSQSGIRTRPMIRSATPAIVQAEQAPNAVAQAPTERRSFSYEPSQQGEVRIGCCCTVTSQPAPETAQRSTQTYRSYSYEPSTQSYSAPRMRSSQSRRPAYLLPKADPNRYRNF
jgi:hypothetical protein